MPVFKKIGDKVNAGTISTDNATYEYEFGKNNYLHGLKESEIRFYGKEITQF